jgi:hypothetical protein
MVVMALLGAAVAGTAIAASSSSGGPITAVQVVRETTPQSTMSTNYVDLPGASTTITVPSGQRALIVARFTAESTCTIGLSDGCEGQVRILIGGAEGAPACGVDCAFDSTKEGQSDELESHAIDRSRGGIGGLTPGNYTVKVQFRVLRGDGAALSLDDWHLTVERSQVG